MRVFNGSTMFHTCFYAEIKIISIVSPRHFSPTLLCAVLFIVTGLTGISMQTLKRQEYEEFSWRNNDDNAKFSVGTPLEHGLAIEYTYFQ